VRALRPRLVALATSTADVVQVAGGWLCDQVLAGWDVTVVTADHEDQRALRILGVRGGGLESALAVPLQRPLPAGHRGRGRTVLSPTSGCTSWCAPPPRPAGPRSGSGATRGRMTSMAGLTHVSHRLSAAARAFKAQAVAATAADAKPADTEEFRRGAIRRAGAGVK
jgi:hypothetical protein